MVQTAVVNKSAEKSQPILRFLGGSYHEGDVIVQISDHERGSPGRASLLLVAYDKEFGMASIHPISFEVLHVLNPEKCAAICKTVKAQRGLVNS